MLDLGCGSQRVGSNLPNAAACKRYGLTVPTSRDASHVLFGPFPEPPGPSSARGRGRLRRDVRCRNPAATNPSPTTRPIPVLPRRARDASASWSRNGTTVPNSVATRSNSRSRFVRSNRRSRDITSSASGIAAAAACRTSRSGGRPTLAEAAAALACLEGRMVFGRVVLVHWPGPSPKGECPPFRPDRRWLPPDRPGSL